MKLKNKKGVTLTELIITITLLGVVMIPVTLMFNMVLKNYFSENDTMLSQQRAREVLYGNGTSITGIIEDLRVHDNRNIKIFKHSAGGSVVEAAVGEAGTILYIQDGLVYSYSGTSLYKKASIEETESETNKILEDVNGFSITRQDKQISSGVVSRRLDVAVSTQVGKGRKFEIQSSYRIKAIISIE